MTDEANPSQPAQDPAPQPPPGQRRSKTWIVWLMVVVAAGVAACFFFHPAGQVKNTGSEGHVVATATVSRKDLYTEVPIPAEFRPYVEAELNAKVSGYLKTINVDFGDKVKAGDLLAVLEVPELKDELNAAIAAEQRTEADYTNAHLIYTRLLEVNREHPNLVAQQEIDTAFARDNVAAAAVTAAKSDVGKYQTLFGYTQITAPFDGVITGRSADPGALIQAGTSSDVQARPVVRLSDNYLLRLDFPVAVDDVKYVKLGDSVAVSVESLGNKKFTGKITRFTGKVNEDTRTMITEIEVPNPDLEIKPGMYAEVDFKLQHRTNVLSVPIEAISSAGKDTVFLVNENNEIEERPVKVGLETANDCEIVSGLKEGDRVMIGSRAQVHPGEKVETKEWTEVTMK